LKPLDACRSRSDEYKAANSTRLVGRCPIAILRMPPTSRSHARRPDGARAAVGRIQPIDTIPLPGVAEWRVACHGAAEHHRAATQAVERERVDVSIRWQRHAGAVGPLRGAGKVGAASTMLPAAEPPAIKKVPVGRARVAAAN